MHQISTLIGAVLLFLAGSCESKKTDKRSRPLEEGEGIAGYLDSTEEEIVAGDGGTVIIGNTIASFPKDAASSDYRVRLSRNAQTPELSDAESAVLGSQQSDVVTIEVYDAATSVVLSSDQLKLPYEFKQSFSTSSPTDKIGLMVISDAGTALEQRKLLPNSELTVSKGEEGLSLSESSTVTITVSLKLTNAVVWLVTYTEDALKVLSIGLSSSLSSTGGSVVSTISTTIPPSAIDDAAVLINSGASYATGASVTLNLTAAGATEMYITGTSGCTSDGSWESFSGSKTWTLTSLNAVSRVYAKFKRADGGESSCVSSSIIHDGIPPSAPGSVNDGATNDSLLASPPISWGASTDGGSGVSRYEIAIGTTAGGTDVKTWIPVGNTTSSIMSGLSLTADETYYASVRAVDASGNVSSATEGDGWAATGPALNCPINFVAIPANSELGMAAFCVMKYEAKNVSGVATSQASGTPWVNIARGTSDTTEGSAWKACKDAGHDLLTNAQWQAIARSIESVPSNWSNGSSSGSNSLNRGNCIENAALSANASDSNGCEGITYGNPAINCGNAWHVQKRTHTLSNGQIIWDIAGNVWEWVQDNLSDQGSNMYVSQLTSGAGYNMLRWGPAGDYIAKNTGEHGGLGYGYLNYSGGAVLRGGDWAGDINTGVFAAELSGVPTVPNNNIGFRCFGELATPP